MEGEQSLFSRAEKRTREQTEINETIQDWDTGKNIFHFPFLICHWRSPSSILNDKLKMENEKCFSQCPNLIWFRLENVMQPLG
jgi:hypothetical protein